MSRAAKQAPGSGVRGRMGPADWTMLLVLAVLWGGSFFFTKVALAAMPPLTLVLGRVAIAAATLLAFLTLTRVSVPRGASVWAAFFAMGFLNNVAPFSLIAWGQTAMPREVASSLASILNATTPIFTILVAHVFTRDERIDTGKMIGVALGFAGVTIMIAPRLRLAATVGSAGGLPLAGMLACLAAALVYGFAGVFGRRFKRLGVTPLQTAFGQVTASTLIMLPAAALIDRPWTLPVPGAAPAAALVGLAVVSTAVAYVLFFRILASAGATNLLLVTFLIPVSAILLAATVLGERLGLVHAAGMALIGLGLAAIDGRAIGRLVPRTAPASSGPSRRG